MSATKRGVAIVTTAAFSIVGLLGGMAHAAEPVRPLAGAAVVDDGVALRPLAVSSSTTRMLEVDPSVTRTLSVDGTLVSVAPDQTAAKKKTVTVNGVKITCDGCTIIVIKT